MTAAAVRPLPTQVRLDAVHGRLWATGRDAAALLPLPGGTFNRQRGGVELSLTLESLRRARQALGLSKPEMAACCSSTVPRVDRAAGRSEAAVKAVHARLATGWRMAFPWQDTTGAGRRPFEHQVIMASVAASLDGCAFIVRVGTGKTRAALEALQALVTAGHVHVALVVCPKAVRGTWLREMQT